MRQSVFEVNLPQWRDPAEIFRSYFQHEPRVVWLDSGEHTEIGMSYIAVGTRCVTASVRTGLITVDGEHYSSTIFDFLRSEISVKPAEHRPGFRLGWVGFLGYALRAQTMPSILAQPRSGMLPRYPDAALIFVGSAVVFDHEKQSVSVIGVDEAAVAALCDRLHGGEKPPPCEPGAGVSAGEPDPAPNLSGPESAIEQNYPPVHWGNSDEEYLSLVQNCQDAITAGDAYQLCLTTQVQVPGGRDFVATYLALRKSSPSHHGAFFRVDDMALLSSSPELFLSVAASGEIESKPIKGTRPRGTTAADDAALAAELVGSEKEQAENLMIVDLVRNDIARVSQLGSVCVPRLLQVESYAQVHQLVSTVRGQLAEGLSGVDAVISCFPAGSMTGAPKSSAVRILEQLENRDRGVYSGAFGYFGLDGRIELAMVIRSILLDKVGATIGTGGGITALSVASEELAEVKLKAAAMLAALGIC